MKYKKLLLIFLLAVLVLPTSVLAIDLGGTRVNTAATDGTYGAGYGAATKTTFAETVGKVIAGALSFVGVIFLALMVYAGYLWMTARGEDEQINKAQKIITSSIIGLIITVGAYSITSFVVPKILESTVGTLTPADTGGVSGEPEVCCQVCKDNFGGSVCGFVYKGDGATACDNICVEKNNKGSGVYHCSPIAEPRSECELRIGENDEGGISSL